LSYSDVVKGGFSGDVIQQQ